MTKLVNDLIECLTVKIRTKTKMKYVTYLCIQKTRDMYL